MMNDYKEKLFQLEALVDKRAKIVAISKSSSLEQIIGFMDAGQEDFGENRVDSLLTKNQALIDQKLSLPKWHFIGNLQSNKINKLFSLETLEYLHSVSSLSLLKKILNKQDAVKNPNGLKIFLQVNISGEEEKSGFTKFDELLEAYRFCLEFQSKNIFVIGLMAMARIRSMNKNEDTHQNFSLMKDYQTLIQTKLSHELNGKKVHLSMGMSNDFEVAIKYGADYIRPGRCLFF